MGRLWLHAQTNCYSTHLGRLNVRNAVQLPPCNHFKTQSPYYGHHGLCLSFRLRQEQLNCCYCLLKGSDTLCAAASATANDNVQICIQKTASTLGRLPDVLAATFPHDFPSMSSARKAIRKRTVLVDGVLARCSTEVAAGQTLQVLSTPMHIAHNRRQKCSTAKQQLDIKYIDEYLLVVVKPFGLHVYGRGTGHLKHWLKEAVPTSTAGDSLPAACPVHRLDVLTGGLIVCARTLTAARLLSQAFENRQIKKKYRALLAGNCQHSNRTIDLAVSGKPATTQLQVVGCTPSLKFGWITTADLFPLTGRKHQLRMHMSAIGHPILGDPLYNQFADTAKLTGRGLCLWSQQMEFGHPVTGQMLQIRTEEPARFEAVRQREAQRHSKFAGHKTQ